MKKLYALVLIFLLALSVLPQTKIGGTGKVGGTAKSGISGAGGGGASGDALIDTFTAGTPRSDADLYVGGHFRTNAGFVRTPTYLCRRHFASQTQTHNLYLYQDGSPDTQLATVSINAADAANFTDSHGVTWNCGAISASAIGDASAARNYYVYSQEFNGGDSWLDHDSTVTATISNVTWMADTFTASLGSHTDNGSGVYVPINVLFAP